VICGTLAFVLAAGVTGVPAIRLAVEGLIGFITVGTFLLMGLLSLLALLAARLSWAHAAHGFRSAMLAISVVAAPALLAQPVETVVYGAFAVFGWAAFVEASRGGASGLRLGGRRSQPPPEPKEPYVPGGDISKTRTGLIQKYLEESADPWRSPD
jgi:hypothetical protein